MDPSVQHAYQEAIAVVSPRVAFVQWKMFETSSLHQEWEPYDIHGDRRDSWKTIEGKRWIYVFRRPTNAPKDDISTLVAEFHLIQHDGLYATAMDPLQDAVTKTGHWPARDKRGTPKKVGSTTSFVRQLMGRDYSFWFFGSRIQLPSKAIEELEKNIHRWAKGLEVTFAPGDPNVLWSERSKTGDQSIQLVPIIDPITIATHLHGFYVRACNDLDTYRLSVEDPDRKRTEKEKANVVLREKKLLLAHIVSSVVRANEDLEKHVDKGKLDTFLSQYEDQVLYRKDWQFRWASALTSWLRHPVMRLLAEAHLEDGSKDFPDFFLSIAHCHSRLCETEIGRRLLEDHFAGGSQFDWIRSAVLRKDKQSSFTPDAFQAMVRRGPSAFFEFVKEHAPRWVPEHAGQEVAEEIRALLEKAFGPRARPIRIVYGNVERGWLANTEGRVKFAQIEWREVVEHAVEHHFEAAWKGAVNTTVAFLQLINFALAVQEFAEALHGDNTGEKLAKFLELIEGASHGSAAVMELFELGSKAAIEKVIFIAAVIDAVIGAKEMRAAYKEGKLGQLVGAGFITAGSLITAAALLVEGLGPIGILIVAGGFFLKWAFRDDSDYEKFVQHCEWGAHQFRFPEEKPKWFKATKTFAEWRQQGGIDEQLRAAMFLLCKFKIEASLLHMSGGDMDYLEEYPRSAERVDNVRQALRRGKLRMGWVPKGAKLKLEYWEKWKNSSNNRIAFAEVEFGDDGKPQMASKELSLVNVDKKDGGSFSVQATDQSKPILILTNDTGVYGGGLHYHGVNPELQRITLSGELELKLGRQSYTVEAAEEEERYGKPASRVLYWR